MPVGWCQSVCWELWPRYWVHLYLSWRKLWKWKVPQSLWPFPFLLSVGRYLLQSREGICEVLWLQYSMHWMPACVWLCGGVLERSGWKQLNPQQFSMLQLSAFRCVFFPGLKRREILSVSGVYPRSSTAGVFVAGETFTERSARCGYVSHVNVRAGRSFGLLCHSDCRACCDSCLLEWWRLCC